MALTAAQIESLNSACPALGKVGLGTVLNSLHTAATVGVADDGNVFTGTNVEAVLAELQASIADLNSDLAAVLPADISHFIAGNLGHDGGVASDGVFLGAVTDVNPSAVLLNTHSLGSLVIVDDGGSYTDETTPANEATDDDVHLVPAAGAENDAAYFGHATVQFGQIDINITTAGNFVGTVTWEYWDGDSWAALSNVTDGTSNFSASAGLVAVTFDIPEDWNITAVDSVSGYWVRGRISAATSGGGHLADQVWIVAEDADSTWTDDTADFTDADAGDVAALPAHLAVGDALYIGGESNVFWRLKVTVSQALAGTLATAWQYWNGSAWTTLPAAKLEDASGGLKTGTSTYLISFAPPADWVANTAGNGPNGESGYFIRFVATTRSTYTAQPLITQGWIKGLSTGSGFKMQNACSIGRVQMTAQTASATNGNTTLLLINLTQGVHREIEWTAADIMDSDEATVLDMDADDELAIVQVAEDGSTEFANVNLHLACEAPA